MTQLPFNDAELLAAMGTDPKLWAHGFHRTNPTFANWDIFPLKLVETWFAAAIAAGREEWFQEVLNDPAPTVRPTAIAPHEIALAVSPAMVAQAFSEVAGSQTVDEIAEKAALWSFAYAAAFLREAEEPIPPYGQSGGEAA